MSGSVPAVEISNKNDMPLTLSRRILWIAVVCSIQMIYVPASNRISGGIEPKLEIDVFPIWSIWVLPYVLCYVLWFASAVLILYKIEDRRFRAFIATCILTFSLGAITFLLFPTYVRRATLDGSDIFTLLLEYIHNHWGRYAALPSGHVYITTVIVLFYRRWYPKWKLFWTLILVVVSLSTLFTGQHYILDVLGGYVVGLAGYRFGLWWAGRRAPEKQTRHEPRKRMASSLD